MKIAGDKPRRLSDFRYDTAEGREDISVADAAVIDIAVGVDTAEVIAVVGKRELVQYQ